jgi:membrane associated rhomboid family serine protease
VNFLSRLAIPGLIRYIVMLNALVFLLMLLNRPIVELIALDPALVLQGQVWRLVTWIFIPTTSNMLWIFFYLMFTWWAGEMLEATWGTARLNLYYFLGWAGCTAAAFFLGPNFGNTILSFSLLLALATLSPDLEILFFFFPMKLKWVALISLVYPWGYFFVGGGLSTQIAIAVCLVNYLIFFSPHLFHQASNQRKVEIRRARFEAAKREADPTLHRCETCGITEASNPEADFRVTEDGREFCEAHLPKR